MEPLKGLIFDLDGTLIKSYLDFAQMRKDLEIETGQDILIHMKQIQSNEDLYEKKMAIIDQHEAESIKQAELFEGVKDFLAFTKEKKRYIGILTRNSKKNTHHIVQKFNLPIDHILTREDVLNQKPHPEGIHTLRNIWKLPLEKVCFIGDSLMDIKTGNQAGVATYFFEQKKINTDLSYLPFKNYYELKELIFGTDK